MFVVIYKFQVKDNKDLQFKNAWEELTKLIYQYEGSLGSRLHSSNNQTYIAYAQWPDKETWENSGEKLPDIANKYRSVMKESCINIETLYELENAIDLLKSEINQSPNQ